MKSKSRFITVKVIKMTEKTPLRYTSIKDLLQIARINYKGKRPSDIYKRLPDMFNLAENAKIRGDEENQYIMLRRWLNCIDWLKTTQEYKDDKTFSLTNIHVNQVGSGVCFIKLIIHK